MGRRTKHFLGLPGLTGYLLLALAAAGTACNPDGSDPDAGSGGAGASAGSGGSGMGGRSSGGNGGGTASGGSSGPSLWVIDYLSLREVDVSTGKGRITDANLLDIEGDIYGLVPGPKQVWLATSEGTVAVLDRETDTTQQLTIDTGETSGISALALGPDSAYVASGAAPTGDDPPGPPLVRIDAKTLTEKARADVFSGDFTVSAESLLVDSDAVWLLRDNAFAVMKIDPQTLLVEDTIFLGEDPNNITGPRKDLYGYGEMTQVGNMLWIFDQSRTNFPLLKLDKSSHEAAYVRALGEEFGDAAAECLNVVATEDSVFVLFCDYKVNKIAKLDGKTGDTLETYDLGPGDTGMLAEMNGKLYVSSPTSDTQILEIDEQSGATRVAYQGSGLISGIASEVPLAAAR